ncbi:DUF4124 domain-containing protein [Marilutibacter chinensis]|uniref:DUF4124 domain-containing protein n=1 Tax=Marilutibacter chinensis TaxID=2912247 RepID=A0ABS9HRL1_9GAMM|nr:DUF4124 domain-containing protein [Lysobacter chinensis]MCF7221574.1 DUF4124 domain-containing protein [Lysobacter chinensis]
MKPSPIRAVTAAWLAAVALAPAAAPAQTVLYRCTDAEGNLTIQNDTPCPPGSQQRTQVVGELPSSPAQPPPPQRPLPEPEWQLPPPQPRPSPPPSAPAAPVAQGLPEPGQPLLRPVPLTVLTDGAGTDTGAPQFKLLDSGTPPAEREPASEDSASASPDVPPLPPLQACRTWDNEFHYSESEEPPSRCAPLRTVGIGGRPEFGAGSACEMVTDTCAAVPAEQLCEAWLRRLRDEQAKLVFARSDNPAATRAEVARIEGVLKDSACR